jgi:hypothetical protein
MIEASPLALNVSRLLRCLCLDASGRQLKNRGPLTFSQVCQQNDLAIRKLQRIVIGEWIVLVDAAEDRGFLVDRFAPRPQTPARYFGLEGQLRARPHANCNVLSSAAEKPRVPKPKSRVVSWSPTFAGRDLTW